MPRNLPASFTKTMGRMQASNNAFYAKNYVKRPGYVPLNDRQSTEWDLRVNLTDEVTATSIYERMHSFKDSFVYSLVSGVEFGKCRVDRPSNKGWITEEEELHVHIAIITPNPVNRIQALNFVRATKSGGEYAVPRNTKHTYIGWRLHHNKQDTKIGNADPIWEYGTLPMDPFNGETGLKIYYMVRMYGNDESKKLYKGFTDLGLAKLAEQRAEKKRKANDEVEELRKRLKEAEDKLAQ